MKSLVLVIFVSACATTGTDDNGADTGDLSGPRAELVADGYHYVSRKWYPAPDCAANAVFCVPAAGSASRVYVYRYEHPDGRIAFATTTQIIGPVQTGTYLAVGSWYDRLSYRRPGRVLLDVTDFDVTATSETIVADATMALDDTPDGAPSYLTAAGPLGSVAHVRLTKTGGLDGKEMTDGHVGVSWTPEAGLASIGLNPATTTYFFTTGLGNNITKLPAFPDDPWLTLAAPFLDTRTWFLPLSTNCLSTTSYKLVQITGAHAVDCTAGQGACSRTAGRYFALDVKIDSSTTTVHPWGLWLNDRFVEKYADASGSSSLSVQLSGAPWGAKWDAMTVGRYDAAGEPGCAGHVIQ